ncbi:MAG: hypothetical protein HY290_15105 [Planctomycetia bacterium]|nr:hypothetical protein [Planctomycetia bacterium]
MSLQAQITQSLAGLKGSAFPKTIGWATGTRTAVEVDFTAVDSLGCAFAELRVAADELQGVPFDRLKTWAENLCRKVTYLLEHIGPLEADAEVQTVLVRSTPPTKQPDQTTFYEMLVRAPGVLSLRRYVRTAGQADRTPCDLQVTHEVLVKLVQDIVAAVPTVAEE